MVDYINIHVYTDGACRKNPGPAAIGIVFLDSKGNFIAEHKECIGNSTNNRAEYIAIIRALELSTKYCRKMVSIFCDSELVVNQINGTYAIKNSELRALCILVKDREKLYDAVVYNHKPRTNKFIKKADDLCNEALDGSY